MTGFVITHLGIIVMLFGGKVGQVGGVEGVMGLHVGQPGKSEMELTERQWIEVGLPEKKVVYQLPYQLDVDSVSAEHPRSYDVGDTGLNLQVEAVRPVFEMTRVMPADEGPSALHFIFSSQRMGQRVEEWISVGESNSPGPIEFRFMRGTPPVVSQPVVPPAAGPGGETPGQPAAAGKVPSVDAFYIFQTGGMQIKPRGMQVGPETGATAKFSYSEEGGKESAKLHLEVAGQSIDLDARAIEGKKTELPGTPYTVLVEKVYRNLHVMTGGGASDGEGPANNPAALVKLFGPLVDPAAAVPAAGADGAANPHGGQGAHGGDPAAADGSGAAPMMGMGQKNQLVFFLAPDGQLAYWGKSPKHGEQAGPVRVNRPISLGWADMQVTVDAVYSHARRLSYFRPADDGEFDPGNMDQYRRGVLCNVTYNGASQKLWLGQQTHNLAEPAALLFGDKTVNLQLTNQTVDLGFPVELRNFEVPKNPGTMTPSDWQSTLQIGPPGQQESATIFMNHPANFPNTVLGAYSGTSYKFSQADARPDDPSYSGVQILRDPGWSGKWIGALLICFGIFTMFYLKPYFSGRRMSAEERGDPIAAAKTNEAAAEILKRARMKKQV
ncbi:MAG TPA: hypothetical protein VL860_03945 [Planctomycetota bacterium]|nr:hypothetical protein [Planctomycetota bacterium]